MRSGADLDPGAAEAYDRAIAADPHFAMAHAAKAQMLARQSNVAAAREFLGAAKEMASGLTEREASHIAFFELAFAGRTDDAIAALYPHLKACCAMRWSSPRPQTPTASSAAPDASDKSTRSPK